MKINVVLANQIDILRPKDSEINSLKKLTKYFTKNIEEELYLQNINADVFVGGSFAKKTFLKSDNYDVDIFVRFDWKYGQISEELEKIIIPVCEKAGLAYEKIHGSRDYFRVYHSGVNGYFEVIPVTKIKKPSEERNVTDLSYFHVSYVKNKINGIEDQVRLAKKFFKAQRVYGAETYVRGFSGYAVELLIIKYRSFIKMLREISKVKIENRLAIDIAKHYKNRSDIFIQVNEAKLHSPIILIDPTYKERNALAALSNETLVNIKASIKKFLKNPSEDFFILKEIDGESLKKNALKNKKQFLAIELKTDKQRGDIAGTKLKKFAEVLHREIGKVFDISGFEFSYDDEHSGNVFLTLNPKKEIIRIGPPIEMKKHVSRFKSEHVITFIKNKRIHSKILPVKEAKAFLHSWKFGNEKMLEQMHILSMNIN